MEEVVMLVLSRKAGEEIYIGEQIKLCILSTHGKHIRVGIEAPDKVRILRGELSRRSLRATGARRFVMCVPC